MSREKCISGSQSYVPPAVSTAVLRSPHFKDTVYILHPHLPGLDKGGREQTLTRKQI